MDFQQSQHSELVRENKEGDGTPVHGHPPVTTYVMLKPSLALRLENERIHSRGLSTHRRPLLALQEAPSGLLVPNGLGVFPEKTTIQFPGGALEV